MGSFFLGFELFLQRTGKHFNETGFLAVSWKLLSLLYHWHGGPYQVLTLYLLHKYKETQMMRRELRKQGERIKTKI